MNRNTLRLKHKIKRLYLVLEIKCVKEKGTAFESEKPLPGESVRTYGNRLQMLLQIYSLELLSLAI